MAQLVTLTIASRGSSIFGIGNGVAADVVLAVPAECFHGCPSSRNRLATGWQFAFPQRWLLWSFWLYGLAVGCWLPVLWLQVRLRDIATRAAREGTELPDAYTRFFVCWVALGIPAFFAFLAIFWLMVAKPA